MLEKKLASERSYKKRYFILVDNFLYEYKSEKENGVPVVRYNLYGCNITTDISKGKNGEFTIIFPDKNDNIMLRIKEVEDMDYWIAHLFRGAIIPENHVFLYYIIYLYMLIVFELFD